MDLQHDTIQNDANGENERAVYSALRDEVLKHTDIQNQLIALTITISGAAFTLGLQDKILPQISQSLILIYPMLVSFLAFGWVHSARRIFVISQFIKEKTIKEKTQAMSSPLSIGSWENHLWGDTELTGIRRLWKRFYSFNVVYIFGVFALPQALAILVVYLKTGFVLSESSVILLLIISILSLVVTIIALILWRVRYPFFT